MALRRVQFYSEQVFAITPALIPARLRQSSGRSITWSVDQVISELTRTPDNSRHVDAPKCPESIYGYDTNRLREYIDTLKALAAAQTETYFRRGRSHTRAIKTTTPILLSAVASYPEPEMKDTDERRRWVALVVEAAKGRWGKRFRCAVAHSDESFYHLHLLVDNVGSSVKCLHMAHAAAVVETNTKAKGAAYRQGGRAVQDWYFKNVGEAMGWARGAPKPQRGRISRPAALSARQEKLEAEEVRLAEIKAKLSEITKIQNEEFELMKKGFLEIREHQVNLAIEKMEFIAERELFEIQKQKRPKGLFGMCYKKY